MSIEPLQEYFNILKTFGALSFDKIDESSDFDLVKIKDLIESNCLKGENVSDSNGYAFLNVSITARGAVVLAEWHSIIERKSLKYRFMDIVEKMTWVIVGMFFTLLGQLISKILQQK